MGANSILSGREVTANYGLEGLFPVPGKQNNSKWLIKRSFNYWLCSLKAGTALVVLWFHTYCMAVTSTGAISRNFVTLICASWLLLDQTITSQRSSSGNTLCSSQSCFLFSQSSLVLTWAAFLLPKEGIRGECAFQNSSFTVLCTFLGHTRSPCGNTGCSAGLHVEGGPVPHPAPDARLAGVLVHRVRWVRRRSRRRTGRSEAAKSGAHLCLHPPTLSLLLMTSKWFKSICKPELDSTVWFWFFRIDLWTLPVTPFYCLISVGALQMSKPLGTVSVTEAQFFLLKGARITWHSSGDGSSSSQLIPNCAVGRSNSRCSS